MEFGKHIENVISTRKIHLGIRFTHPSRKCVPTSGDYNDNGTDDVRISIFRIIFAFAFAFCSHGKFDIQYQAMPCTYNIHCPKKGHLTHDYRFSLCLWWWRNVRMNYTITNKQQ